MAALFGSRVRRLRTAAGLTQAELGDRTHVVSTRITQIERASGAKPTFELARTLDTVLEADSLLVVAVRLPGGVPGLVAGVHGLLGADQLCS
ncbi:helix-turn-helix domain-containing protein [Streptomyces violaceusniger]|uniref:helix-turn-helix transcriptional regulator n=1 Tax=Streptomyces violaceusniger TaxID=68280 RepID=UPI003434C1B8